MFSYNNLTQVSGFSFSSFFLGGGGGGREGGWGQVGSCYTVHFKAIHFNASELSICKSDTALRKLTCSGSSSVYVVVKFYPCFNFNFPFVLLYANIIMIMNIKQRKIKIETRIKLNYSCTAVAVDRVVCIRDISDMHV